MTSQVNQLLIGCVFSVLLLVLNQIPQASAIGCFVCSSINGSEPDCEDTFNNTNRFYHAQCMSGRKGRSGLFPATECIKVKAAVAREAFKMLVRGCVVDDGGINPETEIGRSNHCGMVNWLKFDGKYMKGCLASCRTTGCNQSSIKKLDVTLYILCLTGLISRTLRQGRSAVTLLFL